jgi:hypothetical protein
LTKVFTAPTARIFNQGLAILIDMVEGVVSKAVEAWFEKNKQYVSDAFLGWPRTSNVVAQTFHNVSKLRRKVLLDYIVMMWQYALGRREEQIATAVGPTKAGMIVPQPLPVLHARMRVHYRDGGIALATLSPSPGPRASGAFVPRRSLAARRACMRSRFSFDCEEEDPSEPFS